MKKKFSLGWILSGIAALALMLLICFSWYFRMGGKWGLGIGLGLVASLLMLGVLFFMCRAKAVSIPLNFKKASITEIILIIVFVFFAVISSMLMSQYFVVLDRQESIKDEVVAQVNQIDTMFISYDKNVKDRLIAYDAYLQQVERQRNTNQQLYLQEELNVYSRQDLVDKLESDISCAFMKDSIEEWKKTIVSKTSSLGLLSLFPRIEEVSSELVNVQNELVELDQRSEKGMNSEHWIFSLKVNETIKNYFTEPGRSVFTIWSVIVSLLLAFVMLIPYLVTPRDGRHKGLLWELSNDRNSSKSNRIGGI